jgi:hypothetical protein
MSAFLSLLGWSFLPNVRSNNTPPPPRTVLPPNRPTNFKTHS